MDIRAIAGAFQILDGIGIQPDGIPSDADLQRSFPQVFLQIPFQHGFELDAVHRLYQVMEGVQGKGFYSVGAAGGDENQFGAGGGAGKAM